MRILSNKFKNTRCPRNTRIVFTSASSLLAVTQTLLNTAHSLFPKKPPEKLSNTPLDLSKTQNKIVWFILLIISFISFLAGSRFLDLTRLENIHKFIFYFFNRISTMENRISNIDKKIDKLLSSGDEPEIDPPGIYHLFLKCYRIVEFVGSNAISALSNAIDSLLLFSESKTPVGSLLTLFGVIFLSYGAILLLNKLVISPVLCKFHFLGGASFANFVTKILSKPAVALWSLLGLNNLPHGNANIDLNQLIGNLANQISCEFDSFKRRFDEDLVQHGSDFVDRIDRQLSWIAGGNILHFLEIKRQYATAAYKREYPRVLGHG